MTASPAPAPSPADAASTYRLVMNTEFADELDRMLSAATERVLIEVMTFDGDTAGLAIAEQLIAAAARGVDVQVLADSFATRYVSDRRVSCRSVRREAADSLDMFDRLRATGASVSFTHPYGPMSIYAGTRNHKKIFVIDDVGYIGGINISDHNFAWLDFNIAVSDPATVAALADDFSRTSLGEVRSVHGPIITNDCVEQTFDAMIAEAEHSIVVASPYALDVDLARLLERSEAPSKTLITPAVNNFRSYRTTDPYLRRRLKLKGVSLATFPDFFHAKFVLVDDTRLLVGSSNFGRHSFRCNQEVCVVIDDPGFIAAFKTRVLGDVCELESTATPFAIAGGAIAAHMVLFAVTLLASLVAPRVPALA